MKKFAVVPTLLSAPIVLLLAVPQSALANSSSTHTLKALEFTSLSQQMHNIRVASSKSAMINLSEVKISGTTILMRGQVTEADGKVAPFALSGAMYKGLEAGQILGQLADTLGNFDVAHLGIDTAASKSHELFVGQNALSISGNIVSLYLFNKNTRHATILEAPTSQVLGGTDFADSTSAGNSFSTASPELVLWFEKYFSPDKSETTHASTVHKEFTNSSVVSPFATYTVYDWYTGYNDSYNDASGTSVTDSISLDLTVKIPSNVSTGGVTDQKMEVTGASYNAGGNIHNGFTGWEVTNVQQKLQLAGTGRNQYINQSIESAQMKSAGITASISTGYTVPYTPFSVNFSFNGNGSTTLGNGVTSWPLYDQNAATFFPSGKFLQNVGDYYDTQWSTFVATGYAGTTNANYVAWEWDLWNQFSGHTYHGQTHGYQWTQTL